MIHERKPYSSYTWNAYVDEFQIIFEELQFLRGNYVRYLNAITFNSLVEAESHQCACVSTFHHRSVIYCLQQLVTQWLVSPIMAFVQKIVQNCTKMLY